MAKKLTSLLCGILAVLLLTGCASMLEGEFSSVRQHNAEIPDEYADFPVLRASTYDEITRALITMIEDREEYGVIRVSTYEGDLEMAVNEACMEVANSTPMGAYAVYYLSARVNRIISYYDAEITITYKRTALEMNSISAVDSLAALDRELKYCLAARTPEDALFVQSAEITPEYIAERVRKLYYDDPTLSAVLPEVFVNEYPAGEAQRILEVRFDYPYTAARVENMQEKVMEAVQELTGELSDFTPGEAVLRLCTILAATVEYDYAREQSGDTAWNQSDTAFGALIDGKASGQGFAMALKLMCDQLDIPCMVVLGRRDSVDHGWNIVRLDGKYYHVDASVFSQVGPENAFLLGDGWMSDRCWWDAELYPACDGPLAYSDFAPAEALAPVTPSAVPEDVPTMESTPEPTEEP